MVLVDEEACLGRETALAKACQREKREFTAVQSIPCDEVASGMGMALHFGELSCVFDFAESLPRDLNIRLKLLFEDELSAMVSASTFV